jgi:hypothetical protein
MQLIKQNGFLFGLLAVVDPEIEDGISFKAEIFIERIADLSRYDQGANDKDLGDDELGKGQRFAKPGGTGLAGTRKGLVLEHKDGLETGEYQRGVHAGQKGDDQYQDNQEANDTGLPEQVEMEIRRDKVGEDLQEEGQQDQPSSPSA